MFSLCVSGMQKAGPRGMKPCLEQLWLQATTTRHPWLIETASSEDCTRTSGGVFIAVDSNPGAVVGVKQEAAASIPGDEGVRVFSVYFWHSEGWTPRNEALLEAVLKRARMAGDADMSPVDFERSL